MLNLEESKSDFKKNWSWKRKQELGVDEFSVQKLRENHDTIQTLTSQIQELQERENCMIDLNNCIDELQQQTYGQRLELEGAHHGYVESRGE